MRSCNSCECMLLNVVTEFVWLLLGMNSAVRAVVRMGFYVGCRVFLIKEVCMILDGLLLSLYTNTSLTPSPAPQIRPVNRRHCELYRFIYLLNYLLNCLFMVACRNATMYGILWQVKAYRYYPKSERQWNCHIARLNWCLHCKPLAMAPQQRAVKWLRPLVYAALVFVFLYRIMIGCNLRNILRLLL